MMLWESDFVSSATCGCSSVICPLQVIKCELFDEALEGLMKKYAPSSAGLGGGAAGGSSPALAVS